ncbi:MAG: DUF4065 domain-containing protein [Acidaminococcaceae bacterium]|nr:DUF4065 domain-containing protein [Acidaminococcaceae bacterium]
MDRVIDVAAYITRKYKSVSHEVLDEMKLHKLLYFTQREAFAIIGRPAFDGIFEGWKYGPVCREVRIVYYNGDIIADTHDISEEIKYIADNVIYEYGSMASWKLSDISHDDQSWKNARKGLAPDEMGTTPIKNEDIIEDAKKIRPYDHVWDMYYDEFDDEAVLS